MALPLAQKYCQCQRQNMSLFWQLLSLINRQNTSLFLKSIVGDVQTEYVTFSGTKILSVTKTDYVTLSDKYCRWQRQIMSLFLTNIVGDKDRLCHSFWQILSATKTEYVTFSDKYCRRQRQNIALFQTNIVADK